MDRPLPGQLTDPALSNDIDFILARPALALGQDTSAGWLPQGTAGSRGTTAVGGCVPGLVWSLFLPPCLPISPHPSDLGALLISFFAQQALLLSFPYPLAVSLFPFQSLPSPLPHPDSLCWVFSPSRFQFLLVPQLLPLFLPIWEKAVRPHPLLPLPSLASSTREASWCRQGSRHLLVLLGRHVALSSGHTRSRHGAQPTASPVTLLVWHWARANKPWWEAGYISLGLAPC